MPIFKWFDPDTATHEDFVALNKYGNLLRAESRPDDPPRSIESTIKNVKNWKIFQKVEHHPWYLWEGEAIIASLFASVGFYDDNRHLLQGSINVLPDYRRQGLATSFLPKLVEIAEANERTLLITGTDSTVPAGEAFAEKLGADKGLETHTNQLVLAELDLSLLQAWMDGAKTSAKDFEMGLWTERYPEEDIQDICKLFEVMNDAPRGDLQIEDSKIKPEDLREGEASMKARGIERWELYVRHKLSGELAGFTGTYWDPENPENLGQGGTGVLPKYRGHGLGKWLKAAMIQKVMAERPVVKRIRTGNADSNAAMLAINNALGFKPYIAETVWQIEIEKIKSYLSQRGSRLLLPK
jgi:mycothiol synthase